MFPELGLNVLPAESLHQFEEIPFEVQPAGDGAVCLQLQTGQVPMLDSL